MKFFLPETKILKIQNLAEKFTSEQISARQLASFLGLLQTLQVTLPAITIAPLYFRNLQRDLSKALNFLRRKSKLPDSGCSFLGVKRGVDVVKTGFLSTTGKIFLFQKNRKQSTRMPQRKDGELIWAP